MVRAADAAVVASLDDVKVTRRPGDKPGTRHATSVQVKGVEKWPAQKSPRRSHGATERL
jgi:hypothetical protein